MHFSKCVLAFMASTAVIAAPAPVDDYSIAVRKSIDASAVEQVETLLAQRDEDLVARGFLDPLVTLASNKLSSITDDLSDTVKSMASASTSGKVNLVPTVQNEVFQLEAGMSIVKIFNSATGKPALGSSQISSIQQAITAALTQLYSIEQKSLNSFQISQLKFVIATLENIAKALGIALPTATKAPSTTLSTSSRSSSSTKFPSITSSTSGRPSTSTSSSFTTSKHHSHSHHSHSSQSPTSSSTTQPFTPKMPLPVSTSSTSSTSNPTSVVSNTFTTSTTSAATSTTSSSLSVTTSPIISISSTSSTPTSTPSFTTSITTVPTSSTPSGSTSIQPPIATTPITSSAASTSGSSQPTTASNSSSNQSTITSTSTSSTSTSF